MKKAGFWFFFFALLFSHSLLSLPLAIPSVPRLAQLTGSSLPASSAEIMLNTTTSITAPPMVAAGQYNNGINVFPLVANSRDGGSSWSYRITSQIPALPIGLDNGHFTAASCSGLHCVVAGMFDSNATSTDFPLFAFSLDGGLSWIYADNSAILLPADFVSVQFTSLSCSGLHCVAAGSYYNGTYSVPFLAHSANGGTNWDYPISAVSLVPEFPFGFNGEFSSVSCSGLICVAGGFYNNFPFVAHSHDGGATWAFLSGLLIANLPEDLVVGAFNAVSCSGPICVAAGSYDIEDRSNLGFPLLALSTNGGDSWVFVINKIVPLLSVDFNQGKFLGASCSGLLCVAAGFFSDLDGNAHPLLAVSTNGGTIFNYTIDANISALPEDFITGQFSAVSCDGLHCAAAGNFQNSTNTFPLLASSSNGGLTWAFVVANTIPTLPLDFNNGELISASCSGLFCISAGSYNNGVELFPLLAQSNDGGLTWIYAIDSTTPALPADFMSGGFTASAISFGLLFGSF